MSRNRVFYRWLQFVERPPQPTEIRAARVRIVARPGFIALWRRHATRCLIDPLHDPIRSLVIRTGYDPFWLARRADGVRDRESCIEKVADPVDSVVAAARLNGPGIVRLTGNDFVAIAVGT